MTSLSVQDTKPVRRIKTYIDGFDDALQGGIPEGHVSLICGTAGTMKSSVSFNMLYYEALYNNKVGLYVLLEQSSKNFLNHVKNMEYDLSRINLVVVNDLSQIQDCVNSINASKMGSVIFVDIGAIRKEIHDIRLANNKSWLNVFKNLVRKIKLDARCDLFVLDSLSALYVLSRFEDARIELFYIFEFLRDFNLTSFLVSEMPLDNSRYSDYAIEDFLSDGIIHVRLTQFRRNVVREISVVKMRGSKCNNDVFSLEYEAGQFKARYGGQNPLL